MEMVVEQEIISTSARSTDIQYGSRVRLTAIPENEHVFFRWGGDISETDNPIEVDVLGSMNITGNFDFELINSLIGNWTFPTTNANQPEVSIQIQTNLMIVHFLVWFLNQIIHLYYFIQADKLMVSLN